MDPAAPGGAPPRRISDHPFSFKIFFLKIIHDFVSRDINRNIKSDLREKMFERNVSDGFLLSGTEHFVCSYINRMSEYRNRGMPTRWGGEAPQERQTSSRRLGLKKKKIEGDSKKISRIYEAQTHRLYFPFFQSQAS
jgi:hypothetical protein